MTRQPMRRPRKPVGCRSWIPRILIDGDACYGVIQGDGEQLCCIADACIGSWQA
jgi:hypothetical protein